MPPHPEEPFMEVIVTDKHETAFAQAKVEIKRPLRLR